MISIKKVCKISADCQSCFCVALDTFTRKSLSFSFMQHGVQSMETYRHQPFQSRVDIEHWLKANTA